MATHRFILQLGIMVGLAYGSTAHELAAQQMQRLPPIDMDLESPLSPPVGFGAEPVTTFPEGYQPWWQSKVAGPLAAEGQPLSVTTETLVSGALQFSSQIQGFSDLPLIRSLTIGEAEGEFDWRLFGETGMSQISDPVGNFLTTGGAPRFRESDWNLLSGLRNRNRAGGLFEVSQEFGLTNNNSTFFIPQNQGSSRLRMSYTHPLMRGSGVAYNTSQVYLAMLDATAADQEFSRQLQSHILEVSRAYWVLYVERATLLQRVKLLRESEQIYRILDQRRGLDVAEAQLLRAQSAVAERRSLLARTRTAIRNAESRIISLVNDPGLEFIEGLELLPAAPPSTQFAPVDMSTAKITALELRPEISQARTQIEAAAVRRDLAENEVRPYLNAVLETYVAGLRGSNDIGQSFVNQFGDGQPSYSAGLVFEYPLYNRTARSRSKRRQVELRQLQSQLQTTIDTLMLEVEVAVREVQTSYDELQSKHLAMESNQAEVNAIRKRWEILAGDDPSATLYLDNLLAAQVRLAVSEKDLADALATYNLSLVNLSRADGTMLQKQRVDILRFCADCLPRISVTNGEDLPSYFDLDLEGLDYPEATPEPSLDQASARIRGPNGPFDSESARNQFGPAANSSHR